MVLACTTSGTRLGTLLTRDDKPYGQGMRITIIKGCGCDGQEVGIVVCRILLPGMMGGAFCTEAPVFPVRNACFLEK